MGLSQALMVVYSLSENAAGQDEWTEETVPHLCHDSPHSTREMERPAIRYRARGRRVGESAPSWGKINPSGTGVTPLMAIIVR